MIRKATKMANLLPLRITAEPTSITSAGLGTIAALIGARCIAVPKSAGGNASPESFLT